MVLTQSLSGLCRSLCVTISYASVKSRDKLVIASLTHGKYNMIHFERTAQEILPQKYLYLYIKYQQTYFKNCKAPHH